MDFFLIVYIILCLFLVYVAIGILVHVSKKNEPEINYFNFPYPFQNEDDTPRTPLQRREEMVKLCESAIKVFGAKNDPLNQARKAEWEISLKYWKKKLDQTKK